MATPPTGKSTEILQCAQRLMAAGGFNSFSYADIAEQIGIRKASIHHYFPTKSDLVRTLMQGYRKAADEGLAALEREIDNSADLLKAYINYWEACIANGSAPVCLCALLASEMPILPEEVAFEVRAYFRMLSSWLASVFERGQRQGTLKLQAAAKIEGEIFMATVHGAMMSARAYNDPKSFELIMRPILERLLAH